MAFVIQRDFHPEFPPPAGTLIIDAGSAVSTQSWDPVSRIRMFGLRSEKWPLQTWSHPGSAIRSESRRGRHTGRMTRRRQRWVLILSLVLVAAGCQGSARRPQAGPTPPRGSPLKHPSFGLVVIGDFGSGNRSEEAVARAVRRWTRHHRVDALVTTGDNVYETGSPRGFEDAWSRPYGWVAHSGIPVIAALGNHDVRTRHGRPEMKLFDMPGPWYSRSVGAADIIVLDANDPSDPRQLDWLRNELAKRDKRWRIVVFHQPAFSCARHDSDPQVDADWVPLFENSGVDLVLNGHDHNYQRFAAKGGVTYVVTGGGGNPTLYRLDPCPAGTPRRVVGDDQHYHFVAIEGSPRALRIEAIAVGGHRIDDFSLHR